MASRAGSPGIAPSLNGKEKVDCVAPGERKRNVTVELANDHLIGMVGNASSTTHSASTYGT